MKKMRLVLSGLLVLSFVFFLSFGTAKGETIISSGDAISIIRRTSGDIAAAQTKLENWIRTNLLGGGLATETEKTCQENDGKTIEKDGYKAKIKWQRGPLTLPQLRENQGLKFMIGWDNEKGFSLKGQLANITGRYITYLDLANQKQVIDSSKITINGVCSIEADETEGKLRLFFRDSITGALVPGSFQGQLLPAGSNWFMRENGGQLVLPAGQYQLKVIKDGYRDATVDAEVVKGQETFFIVNLQRKITVYGWIREKQGRGLADANVILGAENKLAISGPRGDYGGGDIMPDSNNEIAIKVLPPNNSGCKPMEQNRKVEAGEDGKNWVDFQFNCATTVSGKIIDTLANKGINNAQIGTTSKLFNGWTTSSNDVKEDGSYILKDVPTGLTTININPWSYERFENRRCSPSLNTRELALEAEKEYKNIDFQFKCIPTTATISGKAVNGEGQPLGGVYIMVNGINYGATNNASAKKGEYLAKGVPAGEIKINAVSPGSRIEQCVVSPENYTITVRESDENKEYTGKDFVVKCAVAAAATTTTTAASPPRPTMIRPVPTTTPPSPPWWDLIWRRIRGL